MGREGRNVKDSAADGTDAVGVGALRIIAAPGRGDRDPADAQPRRSIRLAYERLMTGGSSAHRELEKAPHPVREGLVVRRRFRRHESRSRVHEQGDPRRPTPDLPWRERGSIVVGEQHEPSCSAARPHHRAAAADPTAALAAHVPCGFLLPQRIGEAI